VSDPTENRLLEDIDCTSAKATGNHWMNVKSLLTPFVAILSFLLLISISTAADAKAEEARIKALISHVESLDHAKFVRNGKEYDAKSAAEFLRRKWEANRKSVHTAADFITTVATKSSTTGKPYLIRFPGREVRCGTYLTEQLNKQ
jgi:hypothetical protein